MDISKSPTERAHLLLGASTLEQKMRWLSEQPAASPFQTTWPDDVVYPPQVPCTPNLRFANGAQGLDAPGATAFPVAIAEAATWDPELSFAKGTAVAEETFRAGRNVLLGPGLASGRHPLSGRTSEYYGEDPVLTGVLGAASTRGLEEGNPEMPVVANLKHYVANEQELDREASSSNLDERTFRQIYNLPYEIAIAEGQPGSIMCSYNQINGVYACENDVLQDVLKDELGFEGFVMSDFGSVHSTAQSLDAGLDMELNRPIFFAPEPLHAALEAGEITVEQIDAAAFRVVRALIEVGIFDHPLPVEPATTLTTPRHRALAQRMAEEGSVLLKNSDSVLPLAEPMTVAVIGPTASNTPTADGISAVSVCSSFLPFGGGRPSVPCPDPVAPLDAITERVQEYGGTVVYDDGSDPAAAAAVAAEADVALVFGYYRMGEFSDIPDLNLDGNGDELIAAVAAANPDTVAVLGAGSAVVMPWLDDVKAVLHTWYPGREMGTAIGNLLWGDVNPSGKLPMTFPRSLEDTPLQTPEQYPGVFEDGSTTRPDEDAIRQVNYTEGLQVGYRWYLAQGIEPLFEFGHGLSYTTYEYSDLTVAPGTHDGEAALHVDFTLANTGDHDGEEVAQVYLDLPAVADEPSKRLVAWDRVALDAGEQQDVRITLTADEVDTRHLLEYWDEESSAWTMPEGTFTFHVGASSQDLPLQAAFEATSTPVFFPDVPVGHQFHEAITWLAERGITTGYADGTFRPTTEISRQAMAAYVYRLEHDGADAPECTSRPFPDVTEDNPFCGEIAWLQGAGLAEGYADGTFRPATSISRQAIAAFTYRLVHDGADAPGCGEQPFPDVAVDNQFCGEIAWLKAAELSAGYVDGTFRPTAPTSRQAMAAFLFRLEATA